MGQGPEIAARKALIAVALLALGGLVAGWGVAMRAQPKPLRVAASTPAPDAKPAARLLYVHVAGAVASPGLYRVPEGSRVDDAVTAAGGPAQDADLDEINLAAKLRDGDKVVVPRAGEGGTEEGGGTTDRVNLNAASAADLQELPGIGPALAERIVAHRTEHGPFRTVEDLKKVAGIGPKTFERLKDLVTV